MYATAINIAQDVGTLALAAAATVIAVQAKNAGNRSATAAEGAVEAARRSAVAAEDAAASSHRSADAAEESVIAAHRTADAEERAARIEEQRWEGEQEAERTRQAALDYASRAATLVLHTALERHAANDPASADATCYLAVRNVGQQAARDLWIGDLTCNGDPGQMPVPFVDGAHVHGTRDLLPDRDLRFNLAWNRHAPHWSYDLYDAEVSWTDRNGPHRERLRVDRRW